MIQPEPVALEDATAAVTRAMESSPIGSFALAAVPSLVRKIQRLTEEEILYLADLLHSIAPVRCGLLGAALILEQEPESTGTRRLL